MIKGHGDDIYSHKREITINFSSNVYSRQDMSELDEYLKSKIDRIHSYPEPDASTLTSLLALKYGIEEDNIVVTNGATEAIYLIAHAFRCQKSIIITPTFSEYEDACLINEHKIDYATSLEQIEPDTNLVWLCNPNNPDGQAYHKTYLYQFIAKHPNILFILDLSYEAFVNDEFRLDQHETMYYSNIISLHSLTKSYAIPGLRLGYLVSNRELISKINRYRMPWSVNQLAIEAGKYLLSESRNYIDLEAYRAETLRLMTELNVIDGLIVLPTNTHFFLCELIGRKASDLKQYLIDKHGILIRDASNFRGLDQHFFRIATQSREENDLLINAIKEWI